MDTQSHQKEIRLTTGQEPLPITEPHKFIEIETLHGFTFGRPAFKDAKRFIEQYEWLGYLGRGRITYAIWKDDLLYGVEVFGPLPYLAARVFPEEVRGHITYLSRGACCLQAGKNAGSMLVGACLRELKRQGYVLAVAYSDTEAGEGGYLYKAANFQAAGRTSSKGTAYVLINEKWYSPKSLLNTFGMSNYRKLPYGIQIDGVKFDGSNKRRWAFPLNKKVLPHIPQNWELGKEHE